MFEFLIVSILALAVSVLGNQCVGNINSLASVADAQRCSTINIQGFTIPAKHKLVINAVSGATINLRGNIIFTADTSFQTEGPLFTITGDNIVFTGNDFTIDGQGPKYWDGMGIYHQKRQKPTPMIQLSLSGIFQHVKVLNSPAHVFSMGNKASLVVSNIYIDNSAGNAANSMSDGKRAARNTDGFNVSANNVTIQYTTVVNQDDCIAIKKGININLLRNKCIDGHGISIGSVSTGKTVSNVRIAGNTIVNSAQALRIKTLATATSGLVNGVTYMGNHATGCREYGIIIDQSYPATLGTPDNGVKIQSMVEVNCAAGGCLGHWDWAGLKVSGGRKGAKMFSGINNFT
ncbi:putative endo-polygalacturonase [Rhizoctonia solani 123E]|uniref:endo-polygalacturonase n=1 Tax=Rhizoctonia solani 123E TaxID=1423351 RepID=A0A074RH29_9AGAM|nr:putative endo-polygalacturonase [Rhizoctonia solani 123E]